jgi:hypothetical protein
MYPISGNIIIGLKQDMTPICINLLNIMDWFAPFVNTHRERVIKSLIDKKEGIKDAKKQVKPSCLRINTYSLHQTYFICTTFL